jgi:hypothetical protein
LWLGVVLRAGSDLDLSPPTKRRRWPHLIHWSGRISDAAFHYGSERFALADWRQGLAEVPKRLKAHTQTGGPPPHGACYYRVRVLCQ